MDIRRKVALSLKTDLGLIERLYQLENILDKSACKTELDSKLKKRIVNEIAVLKYDIETLQLEITDKNIEIDAFKAQIIELEKRNNELFKLSRIYFGKPFIDKVKFFLTFFSICYLSYVIIIYDNMYLRLGYSIFAVLFVIYMIVNHYKYISSFVKRRRSLLSKKKKLNERKKVLEDLKQRIYFISKTNDSNSKAITYHSENKEWLEEHFLLIKSCEFDFDEIEHDEVKKEILAVRGKVTNGKCSDNLTANRLAILYNYKLGLKISADQIKGMIIYKNR